MPPRGAGAKKTPHRFAGNFLSSAHTYFMLSTMHTSENPSPSTAHRSPLKKK
jgi:hypothetical protein